MNAQAAIIQYESEPSRRLAEPQTRGYSINLVRNLSPTWLELELQHVRQAGFNLILFPAFNNGWTLFPSEEARGRGLSPINPLFKRWNPLATLCQMARPRELAVWAFARPYNFHPRYSITEHRLLGKFPQWRLRAHPRLNSERTREHEARHPCPLNPEYRRYIGDVLTELVTGYPIEGLVLDFTRFGMYNRSLRASPYCFCGSCRRLYAQAFNADLVHDATGPNLPRVRQWQHTVITEHLSYLRHRLMRSRRTLRFICRVQPFWRDLFTVPEGGWENLQFLRWSELLAAGAIEELLIDPNAEETLDFLGNRLAADYAYLGDQVLYQPIVSIRHPRELARVLEVTGRYPVPGFIAEFQDSLTSEQAESIREQFFPEPAPLPESDPVLTAMFLIERVRRAHVNRPVIADLMTDFVRLLQRQMPGSARFNTLEMIEQNLHGLEQFIRRGRLGIGTIPERTLRDLGLARRFVRVACMDVRS